MNQGILRKSGLLLAFGLGLANGAWAAVPVTPVADAAAANAATQGTDAIKADRATSDSTVNIDGEVEVVDLKNHSLQIKDKTGNISPAVIGPQTTITRNGKLVKLSRIHKGNSVSVKDAR